MEMFWKQRVCIPFLDRCLAINHLNPLFRYAHKQAAVLKQDFGTYKLIFMQTGRKRNTIGRHPRNKELLRNPDFTFKSQLTGVGNYRYYLKFGSSFFKVKPTITIMVILSYNYNLCVEK